MSMKTNHQLPSPEVLKSQYPLSEDLKAAKALRDQEIRRIFTGESDKFVVLVGPCSADNEDSVCEYVRRLKKISDQVSDKLMIIPRDRKSTRLNSSHVSISYAVFCLKKK